jgi:hypothetical protein
MKNKLEDKLERLLAQRTFKWFDFDEDVDYEIWIDETTNEKYRVPIEIVRDFKNAEKLITKNK